MFEVNLVPELKHDAIRALRTRNIILFVCIAASAISVLIVLILLSIKGGQDITMSNQDNRIETLSSKLNAFSDLNELLTIQDQVENLSSISGNKTNLQAIIFPSVRPFRPYRWYTCRTSADSSGNWQIPHAA